MYDGQGLLYAVQVGPVGRCLNVAMRRGGRKAQVCGGAPDLASVGGQKMEKIGRKTRYASDVEVGSLEAWFRSAARSLVDYVRFCSMIVSQWYGTTVGGNASA